MTIILRHPGSIGTDRRSDAAHVCRLVLFILWLSKGATYGFTDGAIFTPNNSIKNSRSRGDSVWQSDKIWAAELVILRFDFHAGGHRIDATQRKSLRHSDFANLAW